MILCLLGMFLSDTGVPGAGDIVRGSSISLERLKNNVELISTGQIWRGTYVLWSSIHFLLSCLLCFFASHRWAALDDNTALILGFTCIGKALGLKEGDIAMKLVELSQKGICLGFFEHCTFHGQGYY